MAELVVVASCDSAVEAHLVRGVLEGAGIPAMLHNEHLVNAQWLYSAAVGGVEVVVPAAFAEDALRLLSEASESVVPEDSADPTGAGSHTAGQSLAPVCPACGGQGKPRWFALLLVALAFALCIPSKRGRAEKRCTSCGTMF